MSNLRILVVGDIVGKPGREACMKLIPEIKKNKNVDYVISNAENIAGGSSLTPSTIKDIFIGETDLVTLGDHTFRKKEAVDLVEEDERIIRPANYPDGTPGRGYVITETPGGVPIAVINLMGRVFMEPLDCPFRKVKRILKEIKGHAKVIVVDMHAEATSEKVAMGWFLDGQVSCVFGTHTHVQTADERVLPKGTGYITDAGMTGPHQSVIGREIEPVLYKFINQLPSKFDVATEDVRLCGAIVDVDVNTGKATHIERVQEFLQK